MVRNKPTCISHPMHYAHYSVGDALIELLECIVRIGVHEVCFKWNDIEDEVLRCIIGYVSGRSKHEGDRMSIAALTILDHVLYKWQAIRNSLLDKLIL
jgi:hypothetical protein